MSDKKSENTTRADLFKIGDFVIYTRYSSGGFNVLFTAAGASDIILFKDYKKGEFILVDAAKLRASDKYRDDERAYKAAMIVYEEAKKTGQKAKRPEPSVPFGFRQLEEYAVTDESVKVLLREFVNIASRFRKQHELMEKSEDRGDGYYKIMMDDKQLKAQILCIIESKEGAPVKTAEIARALFGSEDSPYQNKTYPFVEDLRDGGKIVGTIKRERGKDLGSPWLLKEEDSLPDEAPAVEGEEKVPSAKAEGEYRHVTLSQIKRDPGLRKRKIADARKNNLQKMLICDICGVTEGELRDRYPSGFHPEMAYEVHHIDPLSERGKSAETDLYEVAVLCANCHCMVHIDKDYVKENFEVLQKHFDKQRGKK